MGIVINMKNLTLAAVALISAVSADPSNFPAFDSGHAHCAMDVTYTFTDCNVLWVQMDTEVRSWSSGGPSGGLYAVYEEQEYYAPPYIWTTRTTPIHKYVDDQIFEFYPNGTSCDVRAKSRSQPSSYYDYDTNYCNMWNVFNSVGSFTNLSTSQCRWIPSDPVATCAEY